jgi:hypothetical protein
MPGKQRKSKGRLKMARYMQTIYIIGCKELRVRRGNYIYST